MRITGAAIDLPLFRRASEASLESLAQAAGVKLQVPVDAG
jgi:hypothetical protein